MAWEKIVQRLGSVHPCCPKCRSLQIKYLEEIDELSHVECHQCGWRGIFRELDGIPATDAN